MRRQENQCGVKELGGDHGGSRSILLWRIIIWKAKVSMWNKNAGQCEQCGVEFPLCHFHWISFIESAQYMANIWETSARAVFCISCRWKCTGNLVSSVIVYIHYKQSVLFGSKTCLSELTLIAAEIVLSAACNFTLGACKSTLYFFQIICGKNMTNTPKAPQPCGTSFAPLSVVCKGHKRMQNRFSLHVSCTTATSICSFFPGFNVQLLSSWTMLADKIMKKIATEGRMGHGMRWKDLTVKR